MKVIFLDIDGVLNHNGCRNLEMGYYFVEDDLILKLKKIVDDTGAKVVLSSTWREGWNDLRYGINTIEARLFKKLNHKLSNYGITFISKTPILENGYRGEEIDLWLHNWKGEPIDSFVILDDDD